MGLAWLCVLTMWTYLALTARVVPSTPVTDSAAEVLVLPEKYIQRKGSNFLLSSMFQVLEGSFGGSNVSAHGPN